MSDLVERTLKDGTTAQYVGRRRVLSVTSDGVVILRPKGKATHFTDRQVIDAVAKARTRQTA